MTEKKLNILWLIKGLGLGGAEKLLASALPYLDSVTFNYQVGYFLPWKDALVTQLEETGLKVHCFNIKNIADISAISKLVNYIRINNIDLIHAHLPHPGIIARLAGRITGVPVIYTEHNVWERLHPAMRWLNRLTFSLNTRSITVSQDVANTMRGIAPDSITVIDNGINCLGMTETPDDSESVCREFNVPGDHFIVGNVANLTPKKNHENLLQAFALFLKSCPKATLLLVGQPFDRLALMQNLAKQLGISSQVRFVGVRNDVPRIIKAIDLFVMSSDYEGLPIAMLEAMALKKPIVATAVGGIPGVVREGVDGYLVPSKNPQALAGKMLRIANDCELGLSLGESACQRVYDNYDISRMVQQVENIYRDVLEDRR